MKKDLMADLGSGLLLLWAFSPAYFSIPWAIPWSQLSLQCVNILRAVPFNGFAVHYGQRLTVSEFRPL